MVDEDIVIGYVLGYNDGTAAGSSTIISKSITKNGTYHAADDNADGYDPVIVKVKLSQKEIDDLIEWVIDQIKPQLPDGTEISPPDVDADNDYAPSVDGADRPYLVSVSADGRMHEVMYGVAVDTKYGPSKMYYVDLYADGKLIRHDGKLEVTEYGTIPGKTAKLLSNGAVEVTSRWANGTSKTQTWGPYLTYRNATVWAI